MEPRRWSVTAYPSAVRMVIVFPPVGTVPAKLALYEPYNNRECLHCHAGMRVFEESSPHKEMMGQLGSNEMSCLTCHNKTHDVQNADKLKFWKGP